MPANIRVGATPLGRIVIEFTRVQRIDGPHSGLALFNGTLVESSAALSGECVLKSATPGREPTDAEKMKATATLIRLDIHAHCTIGPRWAGDTVIVSGDLGSHGVAILSVGKVWNSRRPSRATSRPLWEPVEALLAAGMELHCLRDLTRGGLASALNEIAAVAGLAIRIQESAVPVTEAVQGACEILGLDPLYVANEGRFVAFVPERDAARALGILPQGARIGTVTESPRGVVSLASRIGGHRVLDMLSGEQLPRIC
jgi:hydrogenase expression/formation protein HypE